MSTRRQPIGRIVFTDGQASAVSAGCLIDIPATQFREHVKGKAHIGDLVWVQEGWVMYEHKKRGDRYVRVGPMARFRNPLPHGVQASDCRLVRDRHSGAIAHGDPKYLRRTESCLTLEIRSYTAAAVRCLVHFAQVDEFIKSRVAA